jgi:hypothetical protein
MQSTYVHTYGVCCHFSLFSAFAGFVSFFRQRLWPKELDVLSQRFWRFQGEAVAWLQHGLRQAGRWKMARLTLMVTTVEQIRTRRVTTAVQVVWLLILAVVLEVHVPVFHPPRVAQ